MEILFSDAFLASLEKHASLKKAVQGKVDMIIADPIGMGEPLKANFRGYYSAPVKRNFLIVYLYCRICRKKKDNEIVGCHDCTDCPDETLKFIDLGPHDQTYGR
jgi:mRNA-degrading endonuclease YafQ of YafQ-DinJ toxin-antitoxin module